MNTAAEELERNTSDIQYPAKLFKPLIEMSKEGHWINNTRKEMYRMLKKGKITIFYTNTKNILFSPKKIVHTTTNSFNLNSSKYQDNLVKNHNISPLPESTKKWLTDLKMKMWFELKSAVQ